MPRGVRKLSPTGIYHVMIRGINRQVIFEQPQDKKHFLKTVYRYKNECGFNIYSYCLMDNHVHLLIKENDEPLSKCMQRINTSYAHWYNEKYDRYGPLFQGRFRSEIIRNNAQVLSVSRYIHQNPMNAGMANTIFESKWTSLYEFLSKKYIVDTDFILNMFSTNRELAITKFKKFMQIQQQTKWMDDEVKAKRSDEEVLNYLKKFGLKNVSLLQKMNRAERDKFLVKVKKLEGVSIQQIARITGLTKSMVQRAK